MGGRKKMERKKMERKKMGRKKTGRKKMGRKKTGRKKMGRKMKKWTKEMKEGRKQLLRFHSFVDLQALFQIMPQFFPTIFDFLERFFVDDECTGNYTCYL